MAPATIKDNLKQSNKTVPSQILQSSHPYRTNIPQYPSAIKTSTSERASTSSMYQQDSPLLEASTERANHQPSVVSTTKSDLPQDGLEAYLQSQEKRLIITALKQTDWNKTQAAELLGTTFRSLRYRMKKLNIDEDEHDE